MSRSIRAFFTSFGVVVLLLLLAGEGRTASNPLSPPDATSPRASIATFRSHAQEAEKIAWDAANEIKYNKNFFWDQKTYNEARRARQHQARVQTVYGGRRLRALRKHLVQYFAVEKANQFMRIGRVHQIERERCNLCAAGELTRYRVPRTMQRIKTYVIEQRLVQNKTLGQQAQVLQKALQ